MIPIVSIVGKSGVGKTAVVEKLVTELKKRNYRVATVKHSASGFEMDREGKDTWRHSRAGSDTVAISSPQKIAVIRNVDHDHSLAELYRYIGPDFDIIIAEGFKHDRTAKIEVHRKRFGRRLTCHKDELLAVATDENLKLDIPQFGLDDARGMADLIEKRFLDKEKADEVTIFVNEEPIPLNPFVKSIISKTVLAMISALKNVPEAKDVDMFIRRKARE
jgi:molybdopterin-guanine dinucleotide biosynthesis protein B